MGPAPLPIPSAITFLGDGFLKLQVPRPIVALDEPQREGDTLVELAGLRMSDDEEKMVRKLEGIERQEEMEAFVSVAFRRALYN